MQNLYTKALEFFKENNNSKIEKYVVDPIVGTVLLTLKKRQNSTENLAIYAQNTYFANIHNLRLATLDV